MIDHREEVPQDPDAEQAADDARAVSEYRDDTTPTPEERAVFEGEHFDDPADDIGLPDGPVSGTLSLPEPEVRYRDAESAADFAREQAEKVNRYSDDTAPTPAERELHGSGDGGYNATVPADLVAGQGSVPVEEDLSGDVPDPCEPHHWDARWSTEQRSDAVALAFEAVNDARAEIDKVLKEVSVHMETFEQAARWLATAAHFKASADAREIAGRADEPEVRYRDAESGLYVEKAYAEAHPESTVKETD